MLISKEDVMYIAKLAKLKLNDEEAIDFANEFENTLQYFKILDELELDDVQLETPKQVVVRKDIHKKCKIEDLYRNSKVMKETYIEVPKIIE